ncbi:MAG: phytase [Gammaproteobacteria bacterium]|nr:phytase [Gammaproteobacteria bacterium]
MSRRAKFLSGSGRIIGGVALAATMTMLPACDVETAARDVIITLFYDTDPLALPADAVPVLPFAETVPVIDGSDAADDPAIWINQRNPAASWVVGTNKRRGLEVYDLAGARHGRVDAGRVNNVDLRTVEVSGVQVVVVGGTNRTTNTIDVWALDQETGALTDLLAAPIPADLDDPYGFCLYRSLKGGALYAIATDKAGGAAQWHLADAGTGKLRGERVRTIHTETQPEGCVADDSNGVLYIGEEGVGVWRLGAEPDDAAEAKQLIATVRPEEEAEAPDPDSPHRLTADVEGLAIYAPPDAAPEAGYLVASSQGNWTYVVFDRSPPHAYRGTFRVADGEAIDGAGETDGIDVVAMPVGADYPQGLLVVQDGYNVDSAGEKQNQNFKYVSWADVAAALELD